MQPVNNPVIELWQWLEQHQQPIRGWEYLPGYMQENWLSELHEKIKSCCNNLGVELCIDPRSETACLVITAEGNPDYFEQVFAIVKAAPSLPGWTIRALLPPRCEDEWVPPGSCITNLASLKFSILKEENEYTGVRIFIPGYNHNQEDLFWDSLLDILMNMFGEPCFAYGFPAVELVNLPFTKMPAGLYPFLIMPEIIYDIWCNGTVADDELFS